MLKNISIKIKFIIVVAFSLIGLAFTISYTAIDKTSKALIDAKFDQLSTIELSKHTELIRYFKNLENLILAKASNILTTKSFKELKNNFTNEKKYKMVHDKFHKSYLRTLKSFNLYDIFLIDLDGNVIYTVIKEKDYKTNLKTGIYKNSGLARVFNKSLNTNSDVLSFEDFKPYAPSDNVPASFISTPIFINGKKVGILAFQLPIKKINNIMQFAHKYKKAGMGKTGESYLVGDDYLLRSNARFKKENTVGILKVKTKSTIAVVDGDTNIGK